MLNVFFFFLLAYVNWNIINFDVEFCINVSLLLFIVFSYIILGNYITNILYMKINKIYVILYEVIRYNYILILLIKSIIFWVISCKRGIKFMDKLYVIYNLSYALYLKLFTYYNRVFEIISNRINFTNLNILRFVKLMSCQIILKYLVGSLNKDSKV